MAELNKRDIYRMPWSMNDNPIGWLETTDECNIHCPGCYRQKIVGHRPLEKLKEDILFLKQWRNVYNISIAGGEPILHPDIIEIVSFIKQNGMKPLILSNGHALTRELSSSGETSITSVLLVGSQSYILISSRLCPLSSRMA
jgi:MoaA/NifB/PqqE/SkfB family radical SAM enzyme